MYSVEIRGLRGLDDFKDLPEDMAKLASRVLNAVTRRARTRSGRRVRDQIAFGSRYLVGAEGKIGFTPSSTQTLEAKLYASSQPRSLARFVVGNPGKGKGKVRVQVAPGAVRGMPGAFLLNIGPNSLLAVRGASRPRGAYKPRQIGKGLWSLYGPSVAQALISARGRGIWPDMETEIAEELEREYLRQLELELPR